MNRARLGAVAAIAVAWLGFANPARAQSRVATASVGGGWTFSHYRVPGESGSLSGGAVDARGLFGYRTGPVDVGIIAGALLAPGLDAGSAFSRKPESMLLVHTGAFVALPPTDGLPFTITARAEIAYARLAGVDTRVFDGVGPASTTLTTDNLLGSSWGGLVGVGATRTARRTGVMAVCYGADLFAGALRQGTSPALLYPFGAVLFLGADWR